MTSFNLAKKTARDRLEVELDKAASLAIYKLRHAKTITQKDIGQQIAALPADQQSYFCQRLNHHELPGYKT
ncbi:DUF3283 family protein [uncultured Tolumonas sp.]|uniref:DUF3283 family protein n=1 Tax=uncultured Tolumonas sp. TaxID=263765 RepID=UPI002A0A5CD1|nr:DUF3283 family protein [uncultured Tolumonas sp.]